MSATETVLTVADACRRYGEGQLRWKVTSGRWQSPARGVVVLHSGPSTDAEVIQSELFAHGPRAVLGGVSAAWAGGLRLPTPPPVHLLLPHGSGNLHRPGVVVHRTRTLTPSDIHPARAPRRTRLPRAVVDGASWASTDLGAQALLASAV